MATFKIGQRVKNIYDGARSCIPLNAEGIVVGTESRIWAVGYLVHFPTYPTGLSGAPWDCRDDTLVPLTDPLVDAFIESIKRLKPYEEPLVPAKVKERT